MSHANSLPHPPTAIKTEGGILPAEVSRRFVYRAMPSAKASARSTSAMRSAESVVISAPTH